MENGVPSWGQSTSVRLVVWQTGCSWTCIRNAGRAWITYRRIDFFWYGEVPCLRGLKGIRVDASGEVERIRGNRLWRRSWFKSGRREGAVKRNDGYVDEGNMMMMKRKIKKYRGDIRYRVENVWRSILLKFLYFYLESCIPCCGRLNFVCPFSSCILCLIYRVVPINRSIVYFYFYFLTVYYIV